MTTVKEDTAIQKAAALRLLINGEQLLKINK